MAAVDAQNHLHERVTRLEKTVAELSAQGVVRDQRWAEAVEVTRSELRRLRATADEAKRISEESKHDVTTVSDAVRAHNLRLESQIKGFERQITSIGTENSKQTATLEEMAQGAKERIAQNAALAALVQTVSNELQALKDADTVRSVREATIAEAKKTFWTRAPFVLSFTVALVALVVWIINALISQNVALKQQQQKIEIRP